VWLSPYFFIPTVYLRFPSTTAEQPNAPKKMNEPSPIPAKSNQSC
jgi:hypothetical protein